MSESPYTGYVLDAGSQSDMNAVGGRRNLYLIAVTRTSADALQLGKKHAFWKCKILKSGLAVLQRAKELGVDNDTAQSLSEDDAQALLA